jgi:D-xylose transport system substrate-binding protein
VSRVIRIAAPGVALLLSAGFMTACSANDAQNDASGKTIALLLPESKTTRYEQFDRPMFEAKVKELCSDCKVDYYNANQDEEKQNQQVDSALSKGAKVLVLDPVNGKTATGAVESAQGSKATVIAYDRFISNADYYMSFDNEKVGEMQAQAIVDALKDKGSILMTNGAPSDPNAAQFKKGAHNVFDKSGLKVLAEYDNPDWSPDKAQQWTSDQLGKFGVAKVNAVYAANDGQAGGVISALTGAGVKTDALPPVVGQDAELAALQRIVAGQQLMTIYKSIKTEAEKAAEVAVAIVNGKDVGETTDFEGVKSFIFTPVAVTKENMKDSVIADGFYSASDICAGEYAAACETAGIGK